MELPEDGKVTPVEVWVTGGGGAGRFGRVSECGTTIGGNNARKKTEEKPE